MKKLVLGLLAACTVAAPAVAAPFDYQGNGFARAERYDHSRDFRGNYDQTRRWNRGDRFDRRYAGNYGVIGNPRHYRLYDAPRGYRWVRSGNDAVLVAITSGLIGAVLANALN